MKVCILQPYYSLNGKDEVEKCFNDQLALMDKCDESADVIVMPESCHVPAYMGSNQASYEVKQRYNDVFDKKVRELAKRCKALVFANYGERGKDGRYLNVTFGIDKNGKTVAKYYKAHPAPSEVEDSFMDSDYSYSYAQPYVVDVDGVRYGFMTCYDFYMYESFAPLALQNVDVIIGCSHQRSDTHQALEIMGRFLSYNTNAYLLRSSISLGKESEICGCSMAVAPDGTMLANMKSEVGILTVEIDPKQKYYKKKGFYGTQKVSHYEYIDDGRRPWLYRHGGSSTVAQDEFMKYPRLCAHRGFNTVAPENSMPAFGSAVALGAKEIEFDVWSTTDGVLVSCHDDTLDRVSDGSGKIYEKTYEELLKYDFGIKYGEKFKGLKICTFEEILQKFACRVIMNIHVKIWDDNDRDDMMDEIIRLIRKYDCQKHCYFMSSNDEKLKKAKQIEPKIAICVGAGQKPWEIVDRAISIGAQKVQLFKPYFNQEMIRKAHQHGIICNVFWSDDVQEAKRFLEMGIDVILTNDYLNIYNAVKDKLS